MKQIRSTQLTDCSHENVTCVGAINVDYKKIRESNFGPAVNIYAPGWRIYTASWQGDRANIALMTGTSIATSWVTGIMAMYVSWEHLYQSGKDVDTAVKRLYANAQNGKVKWILDGKFTARWPNRLVNSGFRHPKKNPQALYKGAPLAPPFSEEDAGPWQRKEHPSYTDNGIDEDWGRIEWQTKTPVLEFGGNFGTE